MAFHAVLWFCFMCFLRKQTFIILEGVFDRNSHLSSVLLICWQDVFRVSLFYFTKEKEHIFGFSFLSLSVHGCGRDHTGARVFRGRGGCLMRFYH